MTSKSVGTYLRFLRRKSGLSQRDLARIVGYGSASQISRHERSISPPSLQMAFAYEVIFKRPASEIFPGLFYAVETVVEECLTELEKALGNSDAKGPTAEAVARQIEWFWMRRHPESI
jgi:transcriptional regulator with XRE-family HTH domain